MLSLTTAGFSSQQDLSSAYFLQPYSTALQASFGTPPYTFQIIAGSLPSGLTMDQYGNVTGTATVVGTFLFEVTITDSSQPPQQQMVWYSLSVAVGLDTYGGLTALPSSAGATGFFRQEKVNGRWNIISPLGNVFYMTSVFDAEPGFIEPAVMQSRYNGDTSLWATHRGERLLSWGFNALDIYTAQTGLPVGTWGGTSGNPVKLPFVQMFAAAADLYLNPQRIPGQVDPIKNITAGVPLSTYNGYAGELLDVFSPQWQAGYSYEVTENNIAITGGFGPVPWIVGITLEDADYFWAIKGVGTCPNGATYPHPTFLIATTAFDYSSSQNNLGGSYQDPKLYSKYAWVTYLQNKYGSISSLNAAWGSNYTDFGDVGGYGVGTGVLDEDGRHSWMGHDWNNLSDESPQLQDDMNGFLYQYVYQGWSVAVNTIRSYDPNHLIFGPSAIGGIGNCGVRPPVLQALKDAGVQVLAMNYDPRNPSTIATNNAIYDQTGLPQLIWYTVSAQADSYWHGYPGDWNLEDSPTQLQRGQHYDSDQQVFYNAAGSSGENFILGVEWWSLTDSGPAENSNFGLTSDKDNAYDGQCAVIAPSTDQFGFPCGGETANYGDFIDTVTQTNSTIVQQLIEQVSGRLPTLGVMAAPAPGSNLPGSTVTFNWTAGTRATAYWLDVGNVPGGNQYFQSGNLGNVLTATVNGLPTNGTTVYVTLYSLVGSQWESNAYTYTAYNPSGSLAVMTTPAPGSTFTGSTVTFNWTAGAGATAYWLDAGNIPGGNQYYQSGNLGSVLTTTVNSMPTDGSTVYVTLYSLVGSQWLSNAYTYTAYSLSGSLGVMTNPTPGSTLPGPTVTFNWSAGSGSSAYWLDIGNVPGGNQYFQSGNLGDVLTVAVNGLPTNGSTVYATLYSMVAGQWVPNSYTYTAFNSAGGLAVMQTPTPGTTLSGNVATFTWSAGTGATAYWLDIGNIPGGNQYYQSGNLGNMLTTTVYSLPADGSQIYVTLYTLAGSQWLSNAYIILLVRRTHETCGRIGSNGLVPCS